MVKISWIVAFLFSRQFLNGSQDFFLFNIFIFLSMKPLRPMLAHFWHYRHCGLNKSKKLGLIPLGWQLFKLAWIRRNWKKDYYYAAGALQSYRIQFTFMWSPSNNSVEQFGILALPLSCRIDEMSCVYIEFALMYYLIA